MLSDAQVCPVADGVAQVDQFRDALFRRDEFESRVELETGAAQSQMAVIQCDI